MAKLPSAADLGARPRSSGGIVSYHPNSGKETLPGESAMKFGETLSEIAEMLDKKKLSDDKTRVEDAYNQLRLQQTDLTNGQDGFMNRRSGQAVTQPTAKDYGEKFDQSVTNIENTLGDDQQKDMFRARVAVARHSFNHDLLNHLTNEQKVYDTEVYKGTQAVETQQASAHWRDPNAIAASLVRVENNVSTMADKAGWAPEFTQAARLKDTSQVHGAVVEQALANDDLVYAKKYFDAHKDVLDPQVSVHIDNAIERKIAKYEHQVEKSINNVNSVILAGFEPSREQMGAVLAAAKGTSLEGEAMQMVATANATSKFRRMTPAQQGAQLTQIEASIRKDPTKFDLNLLSHFRTIHENQEKAIKESPVTFAVRQGFTNSDDPATLPLDLSKPENLGPQLSARFDLARNMQNVYGADNKPLTPEEVSVLSASLKQGSVQQKREYLGKLYNASGNNAQGFNAMMAQIAPDDPVTAVAGVYAGRGMKSDNGRVVADYILQGQAILHPDKRTDGSPAGGKLLTMPPEKDMREAFTSYERDAFAGKDEARNAFMQTTKAIYAARSVEDGDYSGELNKARWESAMALATGGIEKHKGKSVVMPYGVDYSNFKDGVNQRITSMDEAKQLPPGLGKKLKDTPMENIGDGRYVFRSGDGIMVDNNKRPIIIDFNKPAGPQSSKVDFKELLRERQELQGRLDSEIERQKGFAREGSNIATMRSRLLEIDAQLPGGAIGAP